MSPDAQSAVIVAVPEAEPVVGRYRRRLDHSAVWGVPAHVTVLYPFLPPACLDPGTVAAVRAAVGGVPAFSCTFAQVRWFGADVVYLVPTPAEGFRELTLAVWQRFPDHPPYGGEYAELVPHLTVGSTRGGDPAGLRQAAAEVAPGLPFRARIERARLIVGTDAPGSWRTVADLPLAAASESRVRRDPDSTW